MNVEITELTQSKSGIFNVSQKFRSSESKWKARFHYVIAAPKFLVEDNSPKRYSYSITVFGKLIAHTQQCFREFYSWQVEQTCPPVLRPWSSSPRRIWISSSTSASPAGQVCGNHHGAERDGCDKNQNRKGQDHGALSHGLAYSYSIFSYTLIASRCKSCICSANHFGERILNWLPRLIKYPMKSIVGRIVISKSI